MTITLYAAQAMIERARACHDYEVDTVGSAPAAHFVSELRTVDGIVLPTKHPDPPPRRGGPAQES
jgi:hypothetical protein